MKHTHNWRDRMRVELSDWQLWSGRVVVVTLAVLAGLTVVVFTWLSELAFDAFEWLHALAWWSPLIWTPLCTAAIVWLTRRYAAGAAGSGIPQVMAALDPALPPEKLGLFVSLRLSLAKVVLTAGGLLAGLSLGREGPSVQIAAGVMLQARRLLPARASVSINVHGLLVAGGAAGIAAAFNTPLAGIMFAIEELARAPEQRNSGLIITAIVLGGLVAVSAHGNATYFGVIHIGSLGMGLLLPGLAVALLTGIAGGLFSRLLIASTAGTGPDWMSRLRARRPVLFSAVCGAVVAVIGVVTAGATFGSGYAPTKAMVDGVATMPVMYALFKFLATWLSSWSGVPAGIFAPSLAIGAALGNDVALAFFHTQAPALIALGMVGFLAAATQAPLTAFIIVMEMVDGHAMVLSLMACALVASMLARIISPPLYPSLARMQLGRAGMG
ncbi:MULTISPECIES: chloride channel protein [unclassified Massilia]|uniref:chloride channel protein n=1 Tax=unclassified Massilia TaxID=2609279 RepID=UPI00177D19C4|nr:MULTISPECIES: chloride channel protein [unclassified Massilia]MBD8530536.1 chloride channel protein [Massilia sp. CFBP 13647]MBD8674166.1 chloride channel protein [Massilia sp. CFBP 13721]